MREGVAPEGFFNSTATEVATLLLHGYCAPNNPFAKYPEDWTNPFFFEIPNSNMNHDEFANKVLEFVAANNIDAFSIVFYD